MKLKVLITFLLILIVTQCFSQSIFTVEKQQLKTTSFDSLTESLLIYEVGDVILYFKQQDILNIIESSRKNNSYLYLTVTKLIDTITSLHRVIKIKDNLFSFDSSQKQVEKVESNNPSVLKINEELHYLSAELMIKGLFMLYSKKENSFLANNLTAKRTFSPIGQKNLSFFLPNGKLFYNVIIALGE